MRYPTLKKLPSPPYGKTGWPWTEETSQLPDTLVNGSPWPKISIVTPSLNQSQFIEETIRSVLLQGYPELEYIIIDGGSTDNTIPIIKKYEKWLTYWVSESDSGQSSAINKGFSKSTGRIINWINSDDLLAKNGLAEIGKAYNDHHGHILIGHGIFFNKKNSAQIEVIPKNKSIDKIIKFWEGWYDWIQPSVFFTKTAFDEVGKLNENLHYVMDTDLYCRLLKNHNVTIIEKQVSLFRRHDSAKTCFLYNNMMLEYMKVSEKYRHLIKDLDIRTYKKHSILFLLRRINRLFKDNEYRHAFRYIAYGLKLDVFIFIYELIKLCFSTLKKNSTDKLK